MKNFKKHICILLTIGLSLFLLTGCGPSEEKIAQAQDKYAELTAIHNQAVNAHKEIADDSLDVGLTALSDELKAVEDINLNEMEEEEIDTLIQSMDTMLASYQGYLNDIAQIKADEEAAVIVTIPISLSNETGLTFHKLTLREKGDASALESVLSEENDLADGQHITGLFLYRDVDNTPWILALEDSEGVSYELELPAADYTEEGCHLTLTYDLEAHEVSFS